MFCKYISQSCRPRQLSGYRDSLRAGLSGNRVPVGTRFFATVQDWPRGPPSLLYNGYRFSFPGLKWPGRDVNHPSHLVPRLKKEQSYTSTLLLGLNTNNGYSTLNIKCLFSVRRQQSVYCAVRTEYLTVISLIVFKVLNLKRYLILGYRRAMKQNFPLLGYFAA